MSQNWSNWLDGRLDPYGDAYLSLSGDGVFKYAVICRHRVHYTNCKKRWKKHYRAACKRNLPGTWLHWTDGSLGPSYTWWRIRLSDNVL